MLIDWGNICAIILLSLYIALCAISLLQLAKILLYRHQLYSFQCAFLVLCFIWTFLRVLFWTTVGLGWPIWLSALIYTFPLACQVATNALLVLFYAKVVHRERWHLKRSYFIAFYMVAVLVMTLMTILMSGLYDVTSRHATSVPPPYSMLDRLYLLLSGMYHVVLCVLAAYYVRLLYKQHRALASPHIPMVIYTSVVFVIFMSRAVYDLLTGFGCPVVSSNQFDHHRLRDLPLSAFLMFFAFEVLPTLLILMYFRQIPRTRVGCWQSWFSRNRLDSTADEDGLPSLRGKVNSMHDSWEASSRKLICDDASTSLISSSATYWNGLGPRGSSSSVDGDDAIAPARYLPYYAGGLFAHSPNRTPSQETSEVYNPR